MATVKVMKNRTKKVTVQEEVEVVVCDICGAVADGVWCKYEHTNGSITGKWELPIDVCEKHASIFGGNFSDYANADEDKTAELIEKMKAHDIENPDEEW